MVQKPAQAEASYTSSDLLACISDEPKTSINCRRYVATLEAATRPLQSGKPIFAYRLDDIVCHPTCSPTQASVLATRAAKSRLLLWP